ANITYVDETTSTPLVASLYARFGVTTNILYGNVEILQNTPIGNLIVVLSGKSESRAEAVAYLEANNVTVKTIEHKQNIISLDQEDYLRREKDEWIFRNIFSKCFKYSRRND